MMLGMCSADSISRLEQAFPNRQLDHPPFTFCQLQASLLPTVIPFT